MTERSSRTLVFGSIVGGVVLLIAVIAIIVSSVSRGADPGPSGAGSPSGGSVAKIVKLEHAWRRLDGRNDDGFQVAPFPG